MKSVLIGSCLLVVFGLEFNEPATNQQIVVASAIRSNTTYKVLWDNDEQSLLFKSFVKALAVKYYMDYKLNHDMIFMVDVSGIEHRVLEKDFGKMK